MVFRNAEMMAVMMMMMVSCVHALDNELGYIDEWLWCDSRLYAMVVASDREINR